MFPGGIEKQHRVVWVKQTNLIDQNLFFKLLWDEHKDLFTVLLKMAVSKVI